jgi:hypothetical protein
MREVHRPHSSRMVHCLLAAASIAHFHTRGAIVFVPKHISMMRNGRVTVAKCTSAMHEAITQFSA